MKQQPIVVIETPFAGDTLGNVAFARACLADSLGRGEAPVASHLLYTQPGVLDDSVPEERQKGMTAGWAFYRAAALVAVYTNKGISDGMKRGMERASMLGVPIEQRTLTECLWDDHEFAFPPGSAEPDDDLISRERIVRHIRVSSISPGPWMVRDALEKLADRIERGDT